MRFVIDFRLIITLLVIAVGGGGVSSCARLTGLHDGCVTNADCNPGHQCVAGTCKSAPDHDDGSVDAAPDGSADSIPVDVAQDQTANTDATRDANDARDTNGIPDANGAHDADDAPHADDAPDARDADDVRDADDPRDGGDSSEAPPDTSGDRNQSMSPCFLPTDAAVATVGASLPQDLSGTWRLCSDAANLPPDIHWVLGDTGTIQLDGVYWWRLASGQVTHSDPTSAGAYFRVLEGTRRVFQFTDANVSTGGGATLAVGFLPAAAVLELTSCDGAGVCDGPVARLVSVAGAPGS